MLLLVILFAGLVVVIGGIVVLRLPAFLALTLGALIVAVLTPPEYVFEALLRNGSEKWARTDGIAGDSPRGQLQPQCACQLHHSAFARRIRSAISQTHDSQRAGHVDKAAVSGRLHLQDHFTAAEPSAVDVRFLNLLKAFVRDFIDAASYVDPRTVDQYINLPQLLHDLSNHSSDIRRSRDVTS